MNQTLRITLATLALSITAGGCAVATEEPVTEESSTHEEPLSVVRLASIATEHGTVVEFYEVAPGVITAVETGPSGAEPTLSRPEVARMSAEQLYRLVAPEDAPMPELMAYAVQRRAQLEAAAKGQGDLPSMSRQEWISLAERADEAPHAVASEAAPRTMSWSSWCSVSSSEMSYSIRYKSEERTDNHTWEWDDVDYIRMGVVADFGQLSYYFKYRTWYTWETQYSSNVSAGHWSWAWREAGSFDFDVFVRTYNVTAGQWTGANTYSGDMYGICFIGDQ